jgi:hypothetical protein
MITEQAVRRAGQGFKLGVEGFAGDLMTELSELKGDISVCHVNDRTLPTIKE